MSSVFATQILHAAPNVTGVVPRMDVHLPATTTVDLQVRGLALRDNPTESIAVVSSRTRHRTTKDLNGNAGVIGDPV